MRSVAASAAHIERGLETGEIDLAVGYFPDLRDKSFMEKHLFFHHFVCLLRANHPITATTLSLAQFLSVEHAVVYGAGRTYEIFERYLKAKKIQRRVALETPHFMSIPFVISQSDLIVTVPHAVGVFVQERAHEHPHRSASDAHAGYRPEDALAPQLPARPEESLAARARREPVHGRAR